MLSENHGVDIIFIRFSWPYLLFTGSLFLICLAHPALWIMAAFNVYIHCHWMNAAKAYAYKHGLYQPSRAGQEAPIVHRYTGTGTKARSFPPSPLPTQTGSPLAPPSWQRDPNGTGKMRYWDGKRWTDQYADKDSLCPM
jgi:hypothetical protein